ncbi:hypothetical protein [Nocardioides sp. W7]|uniref:hypothetical protein n=1 Tax=Nocardioides sp. W7 TaxID=2931390 RepID=UPI001FD10457|nr:hypothetical protein [Nocardioides sp. W7]
MDDDLTLKQYFVPDYVLVSVIIEVAACVGVLVACLVLVRRGRAARLGALGALLAGASTTLALANILAILYRDDGPWQWSDWVWYLVNYGRSGGLALIGLAVLLALARTSRPAPAPLVSA